MEIAEESDTYILSDEVYRGTDQQGDGSSASIADLYAKGIATGSMPKSFALAGLQLGWIAGAETFIREVTIHRGYNTISVSRIVDYFTCLALEAKEKILDRSQRITCGNLQILDDWIADEALMSYIKPQSGTTALIKYESDLPSRNFCIRLLQQTGVMRPPGSTLGMEGWIRIGYANDLEILRQGLGKASAFLATNLAEDLRTAESH